MFGMGTGGSLRLLSPETKQGLDPFAAAFLVPSVRPSNGLPTSFGRFSARASHPQNRTGRSSSLARLTLTRSLLSFDILSQSFSLRLVRLCFVSLRLPCFRLSASALRRLSTPLSTLQTPLFQDQALDLLVSSSSIRYRTSTDDLSTSSSLRGLTYLRSGNSLLWGGFTLRCLQRLSRPHFASLLCRWHDNSCTRGASIPVLSY